jgi:hypothetical protein
MRLAVFAVLAANYQPASSRFRQKCWGADGSVNERTANRSLFFRCSSLFFWPKAAKRHDSNTAVGKHVKATLDEICITQRYNKKNHLSI